MSGTSYFISDLHLFSRRSRAEHYLQAIHDAADSADRLILGGDIVDFKWSTRSSLGETANAAIDWLESLVTAHPLCHFHYLLGNHDSVAMFVQRLERLADVTSNLSCEPYFLRIEDCIFLHGDCADRRMRHHELIARRRRQLRRHKYPLEHWLYDAMIHARLHKLASWLTHGRQRIAERLIYYLNDIGQGLDTDLHHVYFGHTHAAMLDYHYRGLTFHNGGAPIDGLAFHVIRTQLPSTPSCTRRA